MTPFLIVLFVIIVVLLALSLWVEVYVKPELEYLFNEIIKFMERDYLKEPPLANKRYIIEIIREQEKLISQVEDQLIKLSKKF
jgi:hypothetical protein